MNTPLFQSLSPADREEWLKAYQQWLSVDFPKVENIKTLTAEVRTVAEQGLHLLNNFHYCRSFVRESLSVRDYHRRMKTIRRYADRVTADVQSIINTTIDLTSPTLLVPHRGRPTKEEAAAKALLAQKQREQEEKNSLFNQSQSEKTEEKDVPSVSFGPMALSPAKLPSLSELRWLMSDTLKARVDTVRDLRSRAEEASTRAKQMAEDNRSADDIAPFAQEARDCFEAVENIYEAVDDEMAVVYVRLKEDTACIEEIAKVSKFSASELRTWLRPYWDKVENKDFKKQQVIDFIKANDPAQAAIRDAQEKKKAQADAIIKYLQRKDKPNTLKRLTTMELRLKELHDLLGDDANAYDALLVAAREDYEQNILPGEEAKRAARAEKKAKAKAAKQQSAD